MSHSHESHVAVKKTTQYWKNRSRTRSCILLIRAKQLPQVGMAPKIDHIVLALPHADLHSPPPWLSSNFTLTPGGRHGDGKTENKLIAFQDGSYIELLAFVDDDPAHKRGHWWGEHGSGYIDYAFTSEESADDVVAAVNDRLDRIPDDDAGPWHGVRYVEPRSGGRTKPDGTEIRWQVTFLQGVRRGELPFWCYDGTARELRVPRDAKATTHPCGAVCVGRLSMFVSEEENEKARAFRAVYSAIVGNDRGKGGHGGSGLGEWELEAPLDVPGVVVGGPVVELKTPDTGSGGSRLKEGHVVLGEITLLTDTSGTTGESRDAIDEELGGERVRISFMHGKQA